jgi:hypothetical protein
MIFLPMKISIIISKNFSYQSLIRNQKSFPSITLDEAHEAPSQTMVALVVRVLRGCWGCSKRRGVELLLGWWGGGASNRWFNVVEEEYADRMMGMLPWMTAG